MIQPRNGKVKERGVATISKFYFCFLSCLMFVSEAAFAYTADTYITESGLFIKPQLILGIEQDDNIYNEQGNTTSSSIVTIIPSLNLKIDDGINYYSLDARVENGAYQENDADDYVDGNLALNAHLEPSDTHRFDFLIKGEWLTESRGSGLTEGAHNTTAEPLTYFKDTFLTTYEYGALETKGRIAFDLKYYEKEYRNFKELTRTSNYDSLLLGSTFYYSTNAHTDAFIEVSAETINYNYAAQYAIKRDSDVYTGLVGMQWDASSILHGFVKLGVQAKEFSDNRREDFSGFSWRVGAVWRPLTYSKVTFSTSQATKDPDIDGDYILATKYKVDWKHKWSTFITSSLSAYKLKDDYSGVSRIDDINEYKFKLNYDLTERFAIAVFVSRETNDSTDATIVYNKNIVGANLIFSL